MHNHAVASISNVLSLISFLSSGMDTGEVLTVQQSSHTRNALSITVIMKKISPKL